MKKIFLALMAVAAIVMTGCTKHETCTLRVTNHYDKSIIVLFSHDKDCRSLDDAEMATHCAPQTYWDKNGVNVKGLYAIIFECIDMEKDTNGSLTPFKYQMYLDLTDFAGNAVVTFDMQANGKPSIKGERL